MIKAIFLVGLGGGIGSIVRYSLALLVTKYNLSNLILATLTANLLGCFIAGITLGYLEKNLGYNEGIRLFLIIGFCGGLTTFSTFAIENLSLISAKQILQFALYAGGSLIAGILAVWAGLKLINQ